MRLFKKNESEKDVDLKKLEEDGASKRVLTGGWEKFIFFFALAMASIFFFLVVVS